MKDWIFSVFSLSFWALRILPTATAAWESSESPAFSASLLYIHAADSSYWPYLTGKLLRDNDTLLILPGVVYKVWCEVLPEGRPSIFSNKPDAIAHRPVPRRTMAHVELHKNLFNMLNDTGTESAKLWCDYTNGTRKLRTTVNLRSFAVANTTCEFSTANGLVAEGSLVNFTCTSWSGFPVPEHSCIIEKDKTGVRFPARVTSLARVSETKLVTTFSMPASLSNQHASIECSAQQRVAYQDSGRDFQESYVQTVRPLGRTVFEFMSESTKQCEMNLTADNSVTVLCQSKGGRPETDHNCWIAGANGSEALPLMVKTQDGVHTSQKEIDHSWKTQNRTVTCVLQQQSYYAQTFTFRIPGFKQSKKRCRFAQLDGALRVSCISSAGLPASQHSCDIRRPNGTTELLPAATKTISQTDGQASSTYFVQVDSFRGAQIACKIKQNGFPPAVFVHRVPQFTESRKLCHFINSSWTVTAVCEFSSGYPATRTQCQLLIANSSVSLNLRPDQERVALGWQSFRSVYTVKLPGPSVSHAGGSIACRVYQGSMFVSTFVYRIAEYQPGARPDLEVRMSSQTVLTLSLALLAALLLLLLMALPIRALRRCFGRSPKEAAAAEAASIEQASTASSSFPSRVDAGAARQTPDFALDEILSDVCHSRGYRAGRQQACMPEIDQYSMFEFGYRPDPSNKRKSVLADALLRCQLEQSPREFRFSM